MDNANKGVDRRLIRCRKTRTEEVPPPVREATVRAVLMNDIVTLPTWFPANQAAAVLVKKNKRVVFVHDRRGIGGIARLEDLVGASSTKNLAYFVLALPAVVTPDLSLHEALQLMDLRGTDVLPVAGMLPPLPGSDAAPHPGVVVGLVMREDVVGALSLSARNSTRGLAA